MNQEGINMDFNEFYIKTKELNPNISQEEALQTFNKLNPYMIV